MLESSFMISQRTLSVSAYCAAIVVSHAATMRCVHSPSTANWFVDAPVSQGTIILTRSYQ